MTTDELMTQLVSILRRHLQFVGDDREIGMSDDLVDLGLDSTGAIGMLLDVQESFSISFPDEMLVPGTFRTAATLLDAIRSLTGADQAT
ncbi:MAG: acyl carrier protein [Planctomycetes bacterium]|nr:acyl carrier protein [Planctomycetota bacterium]